MKFKSFLILNVMFLSGAFVMFLLMPFPSAVNAACDQTVDPTKTPCGNGDANSDGKINLADAVVILSWQFSGGKAPYAFQCPECPPSGLPATGQTLCYNTYGDVIDCNDPDYPGQDGYYQAGMRMENRFIDNGNGTITDNCTGLMWQQEADAVMYTWQEALEHCDESTRAGFNDWRLPNIYELMSINDHGNVPPIDPLFATVQRAYWSSTTRTTNPNRALALPFGVTEGFLYDKYKYEPYYVRAVRTIQPGE